VIRVHRSEERIADRETDSAHLEEGSDVAEIDGHALPGDRYGVRRESAVGSFDTAKKFAGEFAHSEFGQRRRVDSVDVFDDDRRFVAL